MGKLQIGMENVSGKWGSQSDYQSERVVIDGVQHLVMVRHVRPCYLSCDKNKVCVICTMYVYTVCMYVYEWWICKFLQNMVDSLSCG